ncbi:hypothetical protein ES707_01085 [subsurface metagenome]
MNQYLQNIGVGLIGKLIDFGVARISSPHRTSPEQRIEQINKTLETLESVTEVGQPARPPIEALESQNPVALAPSATITTQSAETAPEKEAVATACVPCALGHFSTSTGLLNEAVRFKKDGITSNEIIDRIAKVLEEQNTLERVDLTPEKIRSSPEWERDIAEEALLQSRSLRHRLETIESIDDLEQAAADTEGYYRSLNREWWKRRFAKTGKIEPEMTLDEAKKTAAEADLPGDTPMRQRAQEFANRVRAGNLSRSEAVTMLADDLAKEAK